MKLGTHSLYLIISIGHENLGGGGEPLAAYR